MASPPLSDPVDERGDDPRLPEMPLHETVVRDYDALGFSLNAHPIELVRDELAALKVQPNRTLQTAPQGRRLAVSGLVLVRQRPGTANGVVFITLEDETGTANLIVRPRVWQRWRSVARGKPAIIAEGVVERQGRVVHLMVNRMHDLSARIAGIQPASRDFKINSVFLRQQRFADLGGEPGCGGGSQPPDAAARPAPANPSEKDPQQAPRAAPNADSKDTLKKLRTASRDFR